MRQISNKQSQRNREVAKIKRNLPSVCAICGKLAVDAAHLVPKSIYPEHYTNPLNIVGLCRECHNKYDNNLSFRQRQKRLIERVKSFDECAANRYFHLYDLDCQKSTIVMSDYYLG
ncbi:HNH endonuclease [Bacteroides sp.]|uniref:HNH endonuclease n=1 Tax=Bacteroides sp. TaxID=29523 RepID=UPI00260C7EF8|nr:HNH endonuclease [Bacteroides sp.]